MLIVYINEVQYDICMHAYSMCQSNPASLYLPTPFQPALIIILHQVNIIIIIFWWYWRRHLGLASVSPWAMPQALLALIVFEIGSYFFLRLAWTGIFLFYAFLHSWNDRHTPLCPAFSVQNPIWKVFAWVGLNCCSPNWSYHVAWMTGELHHYQLLFEMGVLWTFCPGLPGTAIFSISDSQVARIMGMSKYIWLYYYYFKLSDISNSW
jgi:hypothetical protein